MRLPTLKDKDKISNNFLDKLGLQKLVKFLARMGLHANHITIISQLSNLISIVFLFENHELFVVFFLSHFLFDALDGYFARSVGQTSKLGDILDHGGDTLFTMLGLIKTFIYYPDPLSLVALVTYPFSFLEFIRLRFLQKQLPVAIFPYFYIFGFYRIGLLVHLTVLILQMLLIEFKMLPKNKLKKKTYSK